MIEEGLVLLIQSGLGDPPMAPGGFAFSQLPKDLISVDIPKAWAYRSINVLPSYLVKGQDPFTGWEVQIDCHGYTQEDAIVLAAAIETFLSGGFRGTLSDSDATIVDGIFQQAPHADGFSDVNRSYVRSLEYLINYYRQ